MPRSRFERWISASFGLARVSIWIDNNRKLGGNAGLVHQLQGLGRFDVELENEEKIVAQAIKLQNTAGATLSDAALVLPDRHIYQSFLWVISAYEFIRTVDQACSKDKAIYGPVLSKDIKDYKQEIERLRIPLAKLEAAQRHPTDYPMAYPVWINAREAAWLVNPTKTISRKQLSEGLLTLTEKLKASTATP
jgi:hypothetical protein